MLLAAGDPPLQDARRATLRRAYRGDEAALLQPLRVSAQLEPERAARVLTTARTLAERARAHEPGGVDALLHEYDLSSEEGVLLMCMAEALLRIPDADTAERLIRDKIARGQWDEHLGSSQSLLVNASTWGLMLTGGIVRLGASARNDPAEMLGRWVARSGEGLVRVAMQRALQLLARHFVVGQTVAEALQRVSGDNSALRYSFDCLGEAARSQADVERYLQAYRDAIAALAAFGRADVSGPGISIKLSALHPRYEFAQRRRVLAELVPRVETLVAAAQRAGLAVTLDAEEASRLELQLDVFEAVARRVANHDRFGLAVQAYQKRAPAVLDWLIELARDLQRRIPVRLVKGAYWDSEIKFAQERGLDGYPVFTRKSATDVCYQACARKVLAHPRQLYGQFASHNAHTLAYVLEVAGADTEFELQRLHGMGEALYASLIEVTGTEVPCRVYAPVGSHEELLPYLMRRLLENGANNSFLNQLADATQPIERVIIDPLARARETGGSPHPRIPLPVNLYQPQRRNSVGIDLSDPLQLGALAQDLQQAQTRNFDAAPMVAGKRVDGKTRAVVNPADHRDTVAQVVEADDATIDRALAVAAQAAPQWNSTPAVRRAVCLERAADLFEQHRAELMWLCVREGGRTIPDALSELREAVDYCRYYAQLARAQFAQPELLPGPTGERNELSLHGRGVFACISPWNFPLAIFSGQVCAALAAGNTVLAKPARQTPLVAHRAVRLLHEAGIPPEALQFLPGSGAKFGARVLADSRLSGVVFTGSTETARTIQQALAARTGAMLPLIAETGGQNVMIADSSTLPEQLVSDVLGSAFNSAGQRCSALRVLFVQREIADRVVTMLSDAMQELVIGDPGRLTTDVGPLIDDAAAAALQPHVERMREEGRLLAAMALPAAAAHGSFFAPHLFEIDSLTRLHEEVFGPILHVVRYRGSELDQVIDAINATGYGLTLGVHSRIEATWERVRARARVGNLYINRNMIGAVVGVQPFGGEGLSGTGPKAGGPHYLQRMATERTVSINTAAVGGNAGLLSLDERG